MGKIREWRKKRAVKRSTANVLSEYIRAKNALIDVRYKANYMEMKHRSDIAKINERIKRLEWRIEMIGDNTKRAISVAGLDIDKAIEKENKEAKKEHRWD